MFKNTVPLEDNKSLRICRILTVQFGSQRVPQGSLAYLFMAELSIWGKVGEFGCTGDIHCHCCSMVAQHIQTYSNTLVKVVQGL